MISRTTKRFRAVLSQLPARVQRQTRVAYQRFSQDPQHPSLRFKKVHTTKPIYSARISFDYRALGVVDGEEVIWFWIGSHSDVTVKQIHLPKNRV